jgi:hypothetical protein
MDYERSIGLVTGKMKKKYIADFHVLVLFMAKNMISATIFFRLSCAVAVHKNLYHTGTSSLQARKLKFWLS